MRVAIVAEYYPRAADPVLGVWAHRQALAARDAGADVHVLVLHRPVPSRAALRSRDVGALIAPLRQPLRSELDGIQVRYVPFVAPPRQRSYGHWGAWAAPPLRLALRRLGRIDLVHAHYAAPAGDAARRAGAGEAAPREATSQNASPRGAATDRPVPLVVSVHGGDLLAVPRWRGGERAVRGALGAARLVLANSSAMADRARAFGAADVRVVHLGTDVPAAVSAGDGLVTVGHLVARKRHEDVLRALEHLPGLSWTVVGDGPERPALERLAGELGVADRVRFLGQLPPREAVAAAQRAGVFALPSVDEAFGVAYVEAMAGAVPAIGTRGEPGPEEIAAAGGGMVLVPPRDPAALAAAITDTLARRAELGAAARATVETAFTWERCGRETVAAYEEALR